MERIKLSIKQELKWHLSEKHDTTAPLWSFQCKAAGRIWARHPAATKLTNQMEQFTSSNVYLRTSIWKAAVREHLGRRRRWDSPSVRHTNAGESDFFFSVAVITAIRDFDVLLCLQSCFKQKLRVCSCFLVWISLRHAAALAEQEKPSWYFIRCLCGTGVPEYLIV